MLLQTVWKLVTAEDARALLIVGPDAGRGDAGDVGANDHLDRQRLALDANHDVWIRNVDDVVGNDALGFLEPPGGEAD